MPGYIDTDRFAASLRARSLDLATKRVLVTRFTNSKQAGDLTVPPNCSGFGRVHHFVRDQGHDWPSNPLPIDPATRALGLPAGDLLRVQVFQIAACSWRCWYCFVDNDLLSANHRHSEFRTSQDLLRLYMLEEPRCGVIDLSGGQPDIVPEWVAWFCEATDQAGIGGEVYIWSDDNLSNDYLWKYQPRESIIRLASRANYGRVGCFKGFDSSSFAFNTGAHPSLYERQFALARRLVATGFDVYGYVTFTSADSRDIPKRMAAFVDRLQREVHPLFPLRTIPLRVKCFTPTRSRLSDARERAFAVQVDAAKAWQEEVDRRFSSEVRARKVFEHRLR